MLIVVSGGSASGKSAFAEGLITAENSALSRIYLATMKIWDKESEHRVARHRAMRADKGFETLECPQHLEKLQVPPDSAILLEDLSNLTANEWFGEARNDANERILAGVTRLVKQSALTVIVTNELFSDGAIYDRETADYLDCLAGLNCSIAAMADRVYEVVCGLPILWKGERI
ncbi:MAG: bifunctional adenosylcobinamide kinase/adenosylcobinamide-phosphate guanylyltransferase [Oscillospiraceae bacterium]